MKKLKIIGLLSGLCFLSACGKTVPTQEEVKTSFLNALIGQMGQFRAMSPLEKDKLMKESEKELHLSNMKCTEVKDLDKVYQCGMLMSGRNGGGLVTAKFIRKNDGSLSMDANSFDVKEDFLNPNN